jgi:EmrB/QacA subfamily drug resistance transporter
MVIRRIDYKNAVALVYTMALFMQVMDSTIINVALPTLADEFDVDATAMDWTVLSFTLALAMMTAAAGWFGDRFGLRPTFLVCLVGFTFASALCGASQSLEQLIAARAVQGGFAGMMIPIGAALVFRAFPLSERAEASRKIITVVVIAPTVGPIIAGILLEFTSWRWIFFINGPIGALAIILAILWLRETKQDDPGRFDAVGFLLSGISITLLLYTLSIGPDVGWTSPKVIGFGLAGVVSLTALIVIELHIDEPILTLRLFKDQLFRTINVAAALTYAGFFGMIFVLPLYMQSVRGYSAFQSGLAQSPQALGVFLVSNLFGRRLYRIVGPRRLMVVGIAATSAITCAYALADLTTPIYVISALSLCRGLAVGLVFVSIQTAAYATTSLADTGRATSLFNTQRQVAYAVGVALAATVIAAQLGGLDDAAPAVQRLGAYQAGFLAVGLIMAPAAIVSWFIHDDDVAATRGLAPTKTKIPTRSAST